MDIIVTVGNEIIKIPLIGNILFESDIFVCIDPVNSTINRHSSYMASSFCGLPS